MYLCVFTAPLCVQKDHLQCCMHVDEQGEQYNVAVGCTYMWGELYVAQHMLYMAQHWLYVAQHWLYVTQHMLYLVQHMLYVL